MIDRESVHRSDVESTTRKSGLKWARGIASPTSEHVVRFYEADAALLEAVATFCADALLAGDVAVVIATAEHRAEIAERLRARGLFDAAGSEEQYLALDAAETLSRFLVDGKVDAARFAQIVGGIITEAAGHGREVKIFGEMVALLLERGNLAAAHHLEELWNDLGQTHDFSLLCAYPMEGFGGEARGELFRDVCEAHAHVIPAESYLSLPTADGRLRAIAELQQKAQSLQAEIEERQRVEERLEAALAAEQDARREFEAALHIRDEFLSIAAHELRNPLASLSLHAQVALRRLGDDENLDAARTERSLQAISEQATRLSHLLDRLLDVSRLDSGQLALERRPTDLAMLVEQAVGSARVKTDRHLITLERPARLEADVDPLRLKQVLTNLLDNAVKFSPHDGPIVVHLSQPAPGTAELAVTDRGIGIPLEARTRVFERFFQARSDDAAQGLGLGLFVSQQIVELHGGQIRVEFPPHGGTRVVISLPTGMGTISELRATG